MKLDLYTKIPDKDTFEFICKLKFNGNLVSCLHYESYILEDMSVSKHYREYHMVTDFTDINYRRGRTILTSKTTDNTIWVEDVRNDDFRNETTIKNFALQSYAYLIDGYKYSNVSREIMKYLIEKFIDAETI